MIEQPPCPSCSVCPRDGILPLFTVAGHPWLCGPHLRAWQDYCRREGIPFVEGGPRNEAFVKFSWEEKSKREGEPDSQRSSQRGE